MTVVATPYVGRRPAARSATAHRTLGPAARHPGSVQLGASPLLGLQRFAGNRAVVGLVRGEAHSATVRSAAEGDVRRTVQRVVTVSREAESRASRTIRDFVAKIVEKVDDDDADKVFLSLVLNGIKLDAKEFGGLLIARRNDKHGNYLTAVVRMLEDEWGTRLTVRVLEALALRGVAVHGAVKAPTSAAGGRRAIQGPAGDVQRPGRAGRGQRRGQRVNASAAAVADILRTIEARRRKAGVPVELAGGAAVAAGALWKVAAGLAADDVTGVGVADDIAIPFVVIGAVVLSGVALFAGRTPPEILDYAPAQAAAKAAVLLMQQVVARPVAPTLPMPPPPPPLEVGKNRDKPKAPEKVSLSQAPRSRPSRWSHRATSGASTRSRCAPGAVGHEREGADLLRARRRVCAARGHRCPGSRGPHRRPRQNGAEPAREAAAPAVEKQKKWVADRPAGGGISQNFHSWSEYFDYKKYDDARVDVENMVGHNLRTVRTTRTTGSGGMATW